VVAPPVAERPPTLFRRIAEPVASAHFIAYPVAFLWAVAAIPLTIHVSIQKLDALGDEQAAANFIVHRLVWPAGASFVVTHLFAVPWLLARDRRRGVRVFLTSVAIEAALAVVSGGASWLWLVLR
jgi:hypothetical protein